jgi:alpha-beta hydrolase superfamily lysophospholipase
MSFKTINFETSDNTCLSLYSWENVQNPKGIVQIAHGMCEHALRYNHFAEILNNNGYIVYANDHRGHGKSVNSLDELGHLSNDDGFNKMILDLYEINSYIKKRNELPIILFGHSMGSFLAQNYIKEYSKSIKGVILCGTNGSPSALIDIGILFTKVLISIKGKRHKSKFINKLAFGTFNNSFSPTITEFDWLSSDLNEVSAYINDPYCGYIFSTQSFKDLFEGIKSLNQNLNSIAKNLPIYIISGSKDPVNNFGKGIYQLISKYNEQGLENIHFNIYENCRHEILNDVLRDKVISDVIVWIDKQLS